jgi:hypothetical protein
MSNTFTGGDWDFCYDKVTCPVGDRVVGMSQMNGAGRRVLCRHAASGAYAGNVTATLPLPASGDNRRTTARGSWAPGYQKLECGLGEYVSAVSEGAPVCQGPGNYRFHAVQCAQGQNLGETCRERIFDAGDDRATNMLDTGDWDVGAYKGECGPNAHVAGVSVSPSTGAPHSLLCCSVDP